MIDEKMKQLKVYYEQYYPFKEISSLYEINDRREISFTLNNGTYIRYNTYNSVEEFKIDICKNIPIKFDFGAIYKYKPSKGLKNIPERKELVFDIDLTDYPRECCNDKQICNECFLIIKVSVKLLNHILKEEFGFSKINFFFSGNRGLHCWVNDTCAMYLSNYERMGITSFINNVNIKHTYVEEYVKILQEYFNGKDFKELLSKYFLKLDINVSNEQKHLLKAPFCIHPTSQRVCVAIDPNSVDGLSLDDIPFLDQVINEPELLEEYVKNIKI